MSSYIQNVAIPPDITSTSGTSLFDWWSMSSRSFWLCLPTSDVTHTCVLKLHWLFPLCGFRTFITNFIAFIVYSADFSFIFTVSLVTFYFALILPTIRNAHPLIFFHNACLLSVPSYLTTLSHYSQPASHHLPVPFHRTTCLDTIPLAGQLFHYCHNLSHFSFHSPATSDLTLWLLLSGDPTIFFCL